MMRMSPKQMCQKQLDYMNHSRNTILKPYFYKMHLALNPELYLMQKMLLHQKY